MTQAEVNAYNARQNKGQSLPQFEGVTDESQLHSEIYDECRRRGWIALHGSMSQRTHRTAGEPDFVILADKRKTILVECKSRSGKLSLDQVSMQAHALKLGHEIHVVRTFGQFLEYVKEQEL